MSFLCGGYNLHRFSDALGLVLYATLRDCISVGDALIDVWFSLLGLSYSLAHTYKFLKKPFFHALWTLKNTLGK